DAAGTLTISGNGFGVRPFVTLDLVPLNLQLALQQRIVVVLPVDQIPPGSYVLTVTRGPLPGETASTDVQIGPPAPAGPAAASSSATSSATPSATQSQSGPAPGATVSAGLPGATDAAARVGDRTFTTADVDREWQRIDPTGYLAASRQLYDARRRIVGDMVNNELLAREATTRGMSVEALLKAELPKRTVALPDNAVTALYQSLGSRTRGATLDQMRPALREWLSRKVEPDLAKMTYVEELTKVSTRADIFMLPPRVDVQHAPDDPTIGPPAASVEVVLFGDFQNPAYARDALTVPRVSELFGARVRFVFKHFPANDSASVAAAEAAACANLQGKFWAFHDALLGQAGALDVARFKKVASDVGADRSRFDSCIDNGEARDRIGRSLEETRRYYIPGSGSLLVNGRLAPEPPAFLPPFEYLKRLIEEELARQAREARD
ncbi:MAG: thioredoxin domain-containing protein, partial [Vicinamibacterales bacterium]